MKNNTIILFSFLLFLSCGSNNKKNTQNSTPSANYINVVKSPDGFNSAYTEDGHTMIYETDSANNYIVYYAKFDDNAGKKGYDRVKDKAVRVEIDSSLSTLISFVSVYGGVSCKIDDHGAYQAWFFDEQMNDYNIELYGIHLGEQPAEIGNQEAIVKRIIKLLTIAHEIAKAINNRNTGSWNYIVSALEPSQSITNYDIMIQETIYAPKVKEHISRLSSVNERLTQLYLLFQDNITEK